MKPERMLLGIVMAIVFVQFSLFSFAAEDEPWQFTWDRALPDMQLRGVNIVSNNIESAWQAAAGKHLLRSVLVKADEVTETTFRKRPVKGVFRPGGVWWTMVSLHRRIRNGADEICRE